MSKILDELTYSDDKIISGQTFGTTSEPSKLKLRAKTFDGLTENVTRRQALSNDFTIPTAFMAQEVYQSNSISQQPITNNFNKTELNGVVNMNEAPKKLKTSQEQINAITGGIDNNNNENQSQVTMMNVPNYNAEIVPKVEQTTPSYPETAYQTQYEQPAFNSYNAPLQQTPVQPNPAYTEHVQQNYEMPSMDRIDAVRQKAYETPIPTVSTEVEKATQTDDFSKLDKVTQEYNKITEEFNKSKNLLESKREEHTKIQKDVNLLQSDISKIDDRISKYRNSIDSTRKDISQIREEMREVTDQINKKIELINQAKEKKLREKLSVEEEASKIMDEIKTNNEKIEQMKQEYVQKDDQQESLAREEEETFDEKKRIQEEYERKLEILKAMTLPTGVNE